MFAPKPNINDTEIMNNKKTVPMKFIPFEVVI